MTKRKSTSFEEYILSKGIKKSESFDFSRYSQLKLEWLKTLPGHKKIDEIDKFRNFLSHLNRLHEYLTTKISDPGDLNQRIIRKDIDFAFESWLQGYIELFNKTEGDPVKLKRFVESLLATKNTINAKLQEAFPDKTSEYIAKKWNTFFVFVEESWGQYEKENIQQNAIEVKRSHIKPIWWKASARLLGYLLEKLAKEGFIDDHTNFNQVIKEHFIGQTKEPFKDSIKQNRSGTSANKTTKPRGNEKIETIIKDLKNPLP